jgi:hypothetical protein
MKEFFVGPSKQSMPEFAHDGLGSRWFYLRVFSVNPYKSKPHIVSVYRQIIHQTWDRNLNWVNEFIYVEDSESYNNGKFRIGNGGPTSRFYNLEEAYNFAHKRFDSMSNIWTILEDKVAIGYINNKLPGNKNEKTKLA